MSKIVSTNSIDKEPTISWIQRVRNDEVDDNDDGERGSKIKENTIIPYLSQSLNLLFTLNEHIDELIPTMDLMTSHRSSPKDEEDKDITTTTTNNIDNTNTNSTNTNNNTNNPKDDHWNRKKNRNKLANRYLASIVVAKEDKAAVAAASSSSFFSITSKLDKDPQQQQKMKEKRNVMIGNTPKHSSHSNNNVDLGMIGSFPKDSMRNANDDDDDDKYRTVPHPNSKDGNNSSGYININNNNNNNNNRERNHNRDNNSPINEEDKKEQYENENPFKLQFDGSNSNPPPKVFDIETPAVLSVQEKRKSFGWKMTNPSQKSVNDLDSNNKMLAPTLPPWNASGK